MDIIGGKLILFVLIADIKPNSSLVCGYFL